MSRKTRNLTESWALWVILCDAHVFPFKTLTEYFENSAGNITYFWLLGECQLDVCRSQRNKALTLGSMAWNTVSSQVKRSMTFVSKDEVIAAPTERTTRGDV